MATLQFSLYLRHGFHSESEDIEGNRVKRSYLYLYLAEQGICLANMLYCFGVVRPAANHVFVKVIESVAAVPNSTYTELCELKRFSMFYFINYLL